MDGKFYTETLERQLLEVCSMLRGKWRLQQDNDPKHTSRVVSKFLDNKVSEVMDQPSNGSDLNPIEIFRQLLKREWSYIGQESLMYQSSFRRNIPNSTLINLVNSMPKRCKEVIEKNDEQISLIFLISAMVI